MGGETFTEADNQGDATPNLETTSSEIIPDTKTATPVEDTTGANQTTDAANAAAYQANYKLSVMGKELEIPEQFRTLIKDADSEKQVREIFEKAFGLDFVKPKHEATKAELETIRKEYEPIKKDLDVIAKLLENNDIGGFCSAFGLTDEMVVKYAMERLEYHQLPPEKRQQVDQQRQQSMKYYQTQQELDNYKAQQAQTELQATVQQLQTTASAPHIQPIAQSFNARAGQPDAFEKAVIAHAQNHFAMTKQDLSVDQAVESFIRTFGLATSQSAPQTTAPAGTQVSQRPPTLPKTGSGSVAPVKSKIRSIDDIRKLSQQQN